MPEEGTIAHRDGRIQGCFGMLLTHANGAPISRLQEWRSKNQGPRQFERLWSGCTTLKLQLRPEGAGERGAAEGGAAPAPVRDAEGGVGRAARAARPPHPPACPRPDSRQRGAGELGPTVQPPIRAASLLFAHRRPSASGIAEVRRRAAQQARQAKSNKKRAPPAAVCLEPRSVRVGAPICACWSPDPCVLEPRSVRVRAPICACWIRTCCSPDLCVLRCVGRRYATDGAQAGAGVVAPPQLSFCGEPHAALRSGRESPEREHGDNKMGSRDSVLNGRTHGTRRTCRL
eukprot:gene3917-biopygen128